MTTIFLRLLFFCFSPIKKEARCEFQVTCLHKNGSHPDNGRVGVGRAGGKEEAVNHMSKSSLNVWE